MAAVFLTAFVAIELTVQKPLVNLRLLKRRNFGIGVLANVLVGFALFGTRLHPAAISRPGAALQRRADRQCAGLDRPAAAALIPLVPLLMKRFDARYIGFVGISIFAASCFMNIDAVAGHARATSSWCRTSCAPSARPWCSRRSAPSRRAASRRARPVPRPGLSNMLRNLGGAVGTATLATVLTKREQFHSNIIGQSVTLYRDEVRQRIDRSDPLLHGAWGGRSGAAQHEAIAAIGADRPPPGPHHGLQPVYLEPALSEVMGRVLPWVRSLASKAVRWRHVARVIRVVVSDSA